MHTASYNEGRGSSSRWAPRRRIRRERRSCTYKTQGRPRDRRRGRACSPKNRLHSPGNPRPAKKPRISRKALPSLEVRRGRMTPCIRQRARRSRRRRHSILLWRPPRRRPGRRPPHPERRRLRPRSTRLASSQQRRRQTHRGTRRCWALPSLRRRASSRSSRRGPRRARRSHPESPKCSRNRRCWRARRQAGAR